MNVAPPPEVAIKAFFPDECIVENKFIKDLVKSPNLLTNIRPAGILIRHFVPD